VSLLLMVLAWPMLPQSVPAHWNAFGQPDQFWDRGLLVAFIALMAVAPSALAVVVHLRRRAALNQVAVTAFALLATTLAMSQVVQTMFYVNGDQGAAPTFVGLLLALVFPFALFVAMSHIGRDAERQRDLEKGPKKERG
jgi:glucan phosphoethanolaminetransferase (alkaline phosphatase superfamily)